MKVNVTAEGLREDPFRTLDEIIEDPAANKDGPIVILIGTCADSVITVPDYNRWAIWHQHGWILYPNGDMDHADVLDGEKTTARILQPGEKLIIEITGE